MFRWRDSLYIADRKARLQAEAQASPAEPKEQQPTGNGSRRTTFVAGGNRRASRQVETVAAPQKRQRRISQKMQEAMDDPEADFGTAFAPEEGR